MKLKAVSGIMLTLLLTSMLTLAFDIQPAKAWTGTVYIRADGSIDPPDAPFITFDNIIYTLTDIIISSGSADDVVFCIFVERNNIVIDGAGYTVQGTGAQYSIGIGLSRNVTLKNTRIERFHWGVLPGSNNTLIGNTIENNEIGIGLCSSSNNTLVGNTITHNAIGIYGYDAFNNVIYHNNFLYNPEQVVPDLGYGNRWDDGYPSGGNYWSDYDGTDADGDGIGDTPYVIDAYNKDRWPLMNPWTPTPPTPDFSITTSPTSLTIQQGSSGTSAITITSIGSFNQLVQLTVSGAPSGVTTTLNPEQVTPPPDGSATSTLTVSVGATATPGSYTLTVTGTSGTLTHGVDISLEITALPPPTENQPPVADAGLDQSVASGDVVWFDGSNSEDPDGTIVNYRWDFGDGTTAEGKVVSHRFSEPKTYTVTLTVKDDEEATDTDTVQVTVEPLKKTVKVFTRPYVPIGEMTVTYNWIDEVDGENFYRVTKVQVTTKGFAGVCNLYVFDEDLKIKLWSDDLKIFPGPPYIKDYDVNILVRGPDSFGISMKGVDLITALVRAQLKVTDWYVELVDKLMKYLPLEIIYEMLKPEEIEVWEELPIYFNRSNSTRFYPEDVIPPTYIDAVPELNIAHFASPGELRVYDAKGGVTGLVNGEVKEEIPNSVYFNNTVMILSPTDSYRYEVAGTEEGSYGLWVASFVQGEIYNFTATNIPISVNAIHQYATDWEALSAGEEGVTVKVDSDGDGVFERTFTSDSELTQDEFTLQVPPAEAFLWWIVGVAAVVIVTAVAAAILWRRRKQPSIK